MSDDLLARYEAALGDRVGPLAFVDLDAFDANAEHLLGQAGGLDVRVASKSLRCAALIKRALDHPRVGGPGGSVFRGVLAFTPAEALHLAWHGIEDILVAYPSVDRAALTQVAWRVREQGAGRIILMVDSLEVAALISEAARNARVRIPVAVDIDASWRPVRGMVVGPRRSPVVSPADAAALVGSLAADPGLKVVGLMAYEGQVAGVGDRVPGRPLRSAVIRAMQSASLRELGRRLPAVIESVRRELAQHGQRLELVNGGGTGSLSRTSAAGTVTELSAGSGLYASTLFDTYQSLALQPAAYFVLPVVRRPGKGVATVLGGGYIASGAAGRDRLPSPVLPVGLELTGTEGAGEVQTPLRGSAADRLTVGDRVYFRHAKAGEPAERFPTVLLVQGDRVIDEVPTYRGVGKTFL
jgi:D-serine deaminase-like pyridoxal phosphate-dependent protein